MSVETDPVPPVPEHTPPVQEDANNSGLEKRFNHTWTRWFTSVRAKINVINDSLVNLGGLGVGPGLLAKNGAAWLFRSIEGTTDRVSVSNGDGAGGNPGIDVATADLIAGSNVSFSGSGVGRIIDNGAGPLTISATGGGGGGSSFTPPPTTGWSWINQGTAAIDSTVERQLIHSGAGGAGLNMRCRVRLCPSPPYVISTYIDVFALRKNYMSAGVLWRNSGNGRIVAAGLNVALSLIQIYKANSATSFSADYVTYGMPYSLGMWIRISDDGTNRIIELSGDGQFYIQIHSVSRTDFLEANEVGFFTNCENQATPQLAPVATLWNWVES